MGRSFLNVDPAPMGPNDQTRVCVDCGGTWLFTEGEQQWMAERGYSAPRRCMECRAAKRLERLAHDGQTGRR